jgi:predicted transcriptional regulator
MTDPEMAEQNEWQMPRQTTASPTRSMADLLFLPDLERSLINWLLRQQQASLAEAAAFLDRSEAETAALLQVLIEQGFVQLIGQACYQPKLQVRKGRNVPAKIWDALE